MGVPKKHKTRSGRNQRRSHHALKAKKLSYNEEMGVHTMPHYAADMGDHYMYKGRKIKK